MAVTLLIGVPASAMSLGTVFYKVHRSSQFASFSIDASLSENEQDLTNVKQRAKSLADSIHSGRYIAAGLSLGTSAIVSGLAAASGSGQGFLVGAILTAPFTIAGVYNLTTSSAEDVARELDTELAKPRTSIDFYPTHDGEFYAGLRVTY